MRPDAILPPMRTLLALALVLPTLARAEQPLDGAAFERLVEGRTLRFDLSGGQPFGIETYHEGRRVTWTVIAERTCVAGTWYESKSGGEPTICFLYEHEPGIPKCWLVRREGERLRVTFVDDPSEVQVASLKDRPAQPLCGGAGV